MVKLWQESWQNLVKNYGKIMAQNLVKNHGKIMARINGKT